MRVSLTFHETDPALARRLVDFAATAVVGEAEAGEGAEAGDDKIMTAGGAKPRRARATKPAPEPEAQAPAAAAPAPAAPAPAPAASETVDSLEAIKDLSREYAKNPAVGTKGLLAFFGEFGVTNLNALPKEKHEEYRVAIEAKLAELAGL
jgi:hypothetical protein